MLTFSKVLGLWPKKHTLQKASLLSTCDLVSNTCAATSQPYAINAISLIRFLFMTVWTRLAVLWSGWWAMLLKLCWKCRSRDWIGLYFNNSAPQLSMVERVESQVNRRFTKFNLITGSNSSTTAKLGVLFCINCFFFPSHFLGVLVALFRVEKSWNYFWYENEQMSWERKKR